MRQKRKNSIATAAALTLLCWAMQTWAQGAPEFPASGAGSAYGGRVAGKVSLVGAYQKPDRLKVFKNRDFCGPWVANETLLVSPDGGVQNTVVILHPVDTRASVRPARLVLDNIQCAFAPHVQVAPLGSELILKNSDPILHTVHARIGKETLFNVGLPNWRQVTKTLGRAGVIKIDCDVLHVWMSAAIVVTPSPYYVVTDIHGSFSFDNLPPGRYKIEVWHERLGTKESRISLTSNKDMVSVEIVYSSIGIKAVEKLSR